MAASRIREEYLFPNSSVYGTLGWDIPSVKKKRVGLVRIECL